MKPRAAPTTKQVLQIGGEIAAQHRGARDLEDAFAPLYQRWRGVPRRDLPAYVLVLIRADALTPTGARHALRRAWTQAEVPQEVLPAAAWIAVWRKVGFVSELDQPVPREPMTLYRGADSHAGLRRMSWTTSLAQARWFADRFSEARGRGVVGVARVAPERILASFDAEQEVVIDPRGLRISVL